MTNENKSEGKQRGAIAWMARNRVAANIVMVMFIVGGLIWMMQIKQEIFPEFEMDEVTVTVVYPGASPDEIEKGVIQPIEEQVRGLDGVDDVTAKATEGVGMVVVEMMLGYDKQKFLQDIKNEIDRIDTFPDDAEEPQVRMVSISREVLRVAIYGDAGEGAAGERALRDMAERMRDRLLTSPDITKVELDGVPPHEVIVEVPQANLRRYGLTLSDIAETIRLNSVEIPGGGIDTEGGELLLRVKRRRYWAAEFEDIPIVNPPGGEPKYLIDIAPNGIKDGFEDIDFSAQYNGRPAIMLKVMSIGDQTPVDVSAAAREIIAEMEEYLPPGIKIAMLNDFSEIYSQRMSLLLKNAYIGLALVFLLLAVFLEMRLAFWIAMGIPTSFLGSFLFLPAMDMSINMMSMFAFIVALGIVVDDAIVVGENIYRWKQKGMSFQKAAIMGAKEVAMPVTFSILTNVAAFMPMFFVPGAMGKIWMVIPSVVVTVFLISLFESLFILPAHLGHYKEKKRRGISAWLHHRQQSFSHAFVRFVRNRYQPFLSLVARNRYITMAVAATVLLLTIGWVASGRMGMTAMPRVESDAALATIKLPYGSPTAAVEAARDEIVAHAQKIIAENGGERQVEGIYSVIGAEGANVCTIRVFMQDPEIRTISTTEFTNKWRQASGRPRGLESLEFSADSMGPSGGKAISVELSHADIKVLEAACADVAEALKQFSVAKDIDDGFSLGKEQLDFKMLPEGLNEGLTHMAVARQVRAAYQGVEAFKQQRDRNEVTVRVRRPREEREHEYFLENLMLRTPSGGEIRLMDAAEFERGRSYTSINRRNQRRVMTVTADADPPSDSSVVLEAIKTDVMPGLVEKYPGLQYSFEGESASVNESMDALYAGMVVAVLAIFAMLAIPMRSYVQPMIIMVSIPFGIVGAVLGHLIMGYGLSIISMLGIVALSGVVVNDALVFIDFANRERKTGKSGMESILSSGVARFRPIMLTTLTTFGGLAPMIFETSRQARFMIPMALSLGYGILFATGISLLLVPSLYLMVDDVKGAFARMRSHVRAFWGGQSA